MSSAYVTKSGYVITPSSASKLPAAVTVSKELFDSMISREVYEALILERDELKSQVGELHCRLEDRNMELMSYR